MVIPLITAPSPVENDPDWWSEWSALYGQTVATANGAAQLADAHAASKADLSYVNTQLGLKVNATLLGANNGVATLDANGRVPISQTNDQVIAEYRGVVANQAAMLALSGVGPMDWVYRTDTSTFWFLTQTPSSTLANWRQIVTGGGGSGVWGAIAGTITDQADLVTELAKHEYTLDPDDSTILIDRTNPLSPKIRLNSALIRPGYLLPDGTELGAAVQAIYDATGGAGGEVTLRNNGTYVWNTGTFLDKTAVKSKPFNIQPNGATITLGASLPIISSFPGGTTRAAIFANTKREALSAGTVTVNDANRATGSNGIACSLVFGSARIETQNSSDVLMIYSNRNAVHASDINQRGGRGFMSWFDYSEPQILDGSNYFESQGGANQVAGAYMFYGHSNGDGIQIGSIKASGSVGAIRLQNCGGAVISGVITGHVNLVNSFNIEIEALHQECGISDTYIPHLLVQSSRVRVNSAVLYRPTAAAIALLGMTGAITINDTSNDTASNVDLGMVDFVSYQDGADGVQGPHIYFAAANGGTGISSTYLSCEHGLSTTIATGSANAGLHRRGTGPIIRAAVGITGLDAALTSFKAMNKYASGVFDVQRGIVGSGGGWQVGHPGLQGLSLQRHLNAIGTISLDVTNQPAGSLANSSTQYTAALVNEAGQHTTLATDVAITPTNGTVRGIIQSSSFGVLRLWKDVGSAVRSAPEAYVDLPIYPGRTTFLDNGTAVNGNAWITSAIPIPNTVAATNETVDRVLFYDAPLAFLAEMTAQFAALFAVLANVRVRIPYNTSLNSWPARSSYIPSWIPNMKADWDSFGTPGAGTPPDMVDGDEIIATAP